VDTDADFSVHKLWQNLFLPVFWNENVGRYPSEKKTIGQDLPGRGPNASRCTASRDSRVWSPPLPQFSACWSTPPCRLFIITKTISHPAIKQSRCKQETPPELREQHILESHFHGSLAQSIPLLDAAGVAVVLVQLHCLFYKK
jgi:hypothetical protein